MTNDRAVQFMAEHGLTCYRDQIDDLESRKLEYIGQAGRYWQQCDWTRNILRKIDEEIAEIKQAAYDRYDNYDDWSI